MLQIRNVVQFSLIILGIVMITPSNSQASPDTSNSPILSLPKLPKNNLRLQQLSDGFLNNTGPRQQSQLTSVSELQDLSPTQWSYEALRGW